MDRSILENPAEESSLMGSTEKTESIDEGKKKLRAYIKGLRNELTEAEKKSRSKRAAANAIRFLETLMGREGFSWVYCYMDLEKEAGTEDIISWCMERRIHIAAPKVLGEEMDFFEIRSWNDLIPGTMGILEPKESCKRALEASDSSASCPVIVPGVAFGRDGSRIGYGGGYYDRFFSREPGHKKAGYCFSFQLFDQTPSGKYDEKMDLVITEDGIFEA